MASFLNARRSHPKCPAKKMSLKQKFWDIDWKILVIQSATLLKRDSCVHMYFPKNFTDVLRTPIL